MLMRLEPLYTNYITPLLDFLAQDVPPGPKCMTQKSIVNLQKGSTFFWVFFLMWYFSRFENTTLWVYAALHGTYGLIWLTKDAIFPDPNWEKSITVPSWIIAFLVVLGPYWISPYIIAHDDVQVENYTLCFTISMHTYGVILMMCSDCQKYFTLKHKKGLISDGFFYSSRNINYLGEMMIYISYAVLSSHFLPFLVLLWVWSMLFSSNMVRKELSLRKKAGWKEYEQRSNLLLPKLW